MSHRTGSYFITGTDTGVGKTVVTALLALHLQARGVDAGIMKPFASGCLRENGELVSEDAAWLKQTTGAGDELDLINPVRFEEPLAPLTAAKRLGTARTDYIAIALEALRELQARHEVVLVEGVGGFLVPLQEGPTAGSATPYPTCADFAGLLGWPVIVVARRTLGTMNHTLLTCRYPLAAPAHFAGFVFSDAQPVAADDVAAATSPRIIADMTGLPILGEIPYLPAFDATTLRASAARLTLPCAGVV